MPHARQWPLPQIVCLSPLAGNPGSIALPRAVRAAKTVPVVGAGGGMREKYDQQAAKFPDSHFCFLPVLSTQYRILLAAIVRYDIAQSSDTASPGRCPRASP